MAKEDFCFTYYDGDATRDMAHMTRLCRGAYNDLVIMQRKVGRMTYKQIKMVLSSDFETCWPAIEMILNFEDEKYWIEWVENSVNKMREKSKKQKERIDQYWEDVKNGKIPRNTKTGTMVQKNKDLEEPLEDGYGNGIDNLKRGAGEKLLISEMQNIFKIKIPNYPTDREKDFKPLLAIANFINDQLGGTGPPTEKAAIVLTEWDKICTWIAADNFYSSKSLKTISTHIQEIFQKKHNGANQSNHSKIKPGKSEGANVLLGILKDELSTSSG